VVSYIPLFILKGQTKKDIVHTKVTYMEVGNMNLIAIMN
jgi:hypothetical protein